MNIGLIDILGECLQFNYTVDAKIILSFATFVVTFLTATFLLYDIFRGKNRKIGGSKWHSAFIASAFSYYSMSVYAFVRFLDGIDDKDFLMNTPGVSTTLSQQALILEIPLAGVAITTFIFLLIYFFTYIKVKPNEK